MNRGPDDPDSDGPAGRGDASTGGGTLRQMGRYGGHGLTMGATTALFAWLGHLLDGALGTGSLFVILGAAIGFAGGFYAMYRDLVLRDGGSDDGGGPRDG
ncbi:MAG: AtpZ/AtpI family protein [Gemmatimonadota bacterium]